MTTKDREHWIVLLEPLLARRGLSWEELSKSCQQIILFGSRAAGVSREGSDFDLMCIGPGLSRLGPSLDLVFVTPEDCRRKRWLGSELAGHVAKYGQWLVGEPDWVRQVRPSLDAKERKAEKLRRRLQAVEESFPLLDALYREKHLVLLRRDLQRHELLAQGEPIPPTPLLDQVWARIPHAREELERLARGARLKPKFLLEHLSSSQC